MHKAYGVDPPGNVPIQKQRGKQHQCPNVVNQKRLIAEPIDSVYLIFHNNVEHVVGLCEDEKHTCDVVRPEMFFKVVASSVQESPDACYEEGRYHDDVPVVPDVVQAVVCVFEHLVAKMDINNLDSHIDKSLGRAKMVQIGFLSNLILIDKKDNANIYQIRNMRRATLTCLGKGFDHCSVYKFKNQIFYTNYIAISIEYNGMRNKHLSKFKAKKHSKLRTASLQHAPSSQNGFCEPIPKKQGMTNSLTANNSKANRNRMALRRKRVYPRRVGLVRNKFNRASYFQKKKQMIAMARQKQVNIANKQNVYRKTSQEYFRKLSAESVVVSHSHSRKVSWKQEDSCRFFDKGRPANEFEMDA